MTPCELENEVVTPFVLADYGYYLRASNYEFGKPRPHGFPKICPLGQSLRTLTPGDTGY